MGNSQCPATNATADFLAPPVEWLPVVTHTRVHTYPAYPTKGLGAFLTRDFLMTAMSSCTPPRSSLPPMPSTSSMMISRFCVTAPLILIAPLPEAPAS